MPRPVVLLCPPIDSRYLATLLRQHAPSLPVTAVSTAEDLERVMAGASPRTRLIGFLTGVVVPPDILGRLDSPAYNFHPGPPAYPGRHPVAFALYDRAKRFGATAHEMAARVDSGPIVGVVDFEVPDGADHERLKEQAYRAMIHLFMLLAPRLATSPEPLRPVAAAWSGRRCSRKALEALCDLPPDLDRDELERRIHAFRDAEGATLSMTRHGRRFLLER